MPESRSVITVLYLYNSNAGLKWQRGCMVKVNINLKILPNASSPKRNVQYNLLDEWIPLFKQE